MRRKDREMYRDFALEVCDKCEWAVISMIDPDGKPYCVALSIARENDVIYFHGAKRGLKYDCLNRNNEVCVSCIGDTYRVPDKFTTEFESALIRGKAYEVTDKDEEIHALKLICARHTPANMSNFDEAIAGSLARTAVWKIIIDEATGKRKKYGADGVEIKMRLTD